MNAPFLIVETGQPVAPAAPPRRLRALDPRGRRPAAARGGGGERGSRRATCRAREGFAGVIVTGSGAMVTDRADWSERSADWLRDAAHDGMSLLGICYGHQLLAHALGGEVGDNPAGREIGHGALELHAAAASDDPLFSGLPLTVRRTGHPPADRAAAAARARRCWPVRSTTLATPSAGATAPGACSSIPNSARAMRGYVQARREALAQEGPATSRCCSGAAAPHARRVLSRFVRHARRRG